MSMPCYICGAQTRIINSRFIKIGVYTKRRYECTKKHRFTTVEEVVKDGVLKSRNVHKNRPSELAKIAVMDRLKQILEIE